MLPRIGISLLGLAFLALASMNGIVAQEPYDIAIIGGHVSDPETGLDAVRSIGIRGDLIAVVSEEGLDAATVIDARGLVVAPGFIDILASPPRADEGAVFKIFDGVTSVVSMHGGPVGTAEWYEERGRSGSFCRGCGLRPAGRRRRAAGGAPLPPPPCAGT